MDKVIIFGVNLFSAVVYQSIIREKKAEILCFTLNKEYITSNSFEGHPVIPFEELDSHFDMSYVKIAITVGYSKMNENRAIVYNKCKEKGYNVYTFISDDAYIMSEVREGEGSIILPQSYIGPYVEVGRCVIIWNQVNIGHHIKIGDFTYIAGNTLIGGGTKIGAHCFLGMSCIINNGIEIGDKTLIGAGCFMRESTEGNNVFVGNPDKCLDKDPNIVIRLVK